MAKLARKCFASLKHFIPKAEEEEKSRVIVVDESGEGIIDPGKGPVDLEFQAGATEKTPEQLEQDLKQLLIVKEHVLRELLKNNSNLSDPGFDEGWISKELNTFKRKFRKDHGLEKDS